MSKYVIWSLFATFNGLDSVLDALSTNFSRVFGNIPVLGCFKWMQILQYTSTLIKAQFIIAFLLTWYPGKRSCAFTPSVSIRLRVLKLNPFVCWENSDPKPTYRHDSVNYMQPKVDTDINFKTWIFSLVPGPLSALILQPSAFKCATLKWPGYK